MELTPEDLAAYDGSSPDRPILLAVCGVVYDVTEGRQFYGPGGPYRIFAGRECGRALARNSLEAEDVGVATGDLNAWDRDRLRDWIDRLAAKYPAVGTIRAMPISSTAPSRPR